MYHPQIDICLLLISVIKMNKRRDPCLDVFLQSGLKTIQMARSHCYASSIHNGACQNYGKFKSINDTSQVNVPFCKKLEVAHSLSFSNLGLISNIHILRALQVNV